MVGALGGKHRTARVDHYQQHMGVLAFGFRRAMDGKDIAGEADQMIAVMGNIGDDAASLGQTGGGPWSGKMHRGGHARPRDLRTGWACSWARIQSWTEVRR